MVQQEQTLFGEEASALKKSQVVSYPVTADKRLSLMAQVVGDFSLIPTSAIDHICLIGGIGLKDFRVPTGTKSAKKGFTVIAKW